MKTLLLVDHSYIAYSSIFVHGNAHSKTGEFTGGLYGYTQKITSALTKFKASSIIVCKDVKPYNRSDMYPAYKQNRKKDPAFKEMLGATMPQLDGLLELLQIPSVGHKGLEADDLIAILAKRFKDKFDRIIILSKDNDLYQLLEQGNVYLALKDKLYGFDDFQKEYPEITTEKWRWMTALSGGHNDLPKIKGLGIKTAYKIVQETELANIPLIREGMHEKLLRLNYDLCCLPNKTVSIRLPIMRRKVDVRKTLRYLAKYGISFTSTMMESVEVLNHE